MNKTQTLVRIAGIVVVTACCLVAVPAAAQAPAPQAPAAQPPAPQDRDGVRFRGGIAVSGGGTFVAGWKLGMAGLDGRLGVQINDLLGIYVQPHFSIGGGSRAGVTGLTGFAGGALMADVTLRDRYFAGAGGGVTILNNPVAGELHFRAGAYPIMGYGRDGIRRKGLMLGIDFRTYFAEGGLNVVNVMGSIGYEAY